MGAVKENPLRDNGFIQFFTYFVSGRHMSGVKNIDTL